MARYCEETMLSKFLLFKCQWGIKKFIVWQGKTSNKQKFDKLDTDTLDPNTLAYEYR